MPVMLAWLFEGKYLNWVGLNNGSGIIGISTPDMGTSSKQWVSRYHLHSYKGSSIMMGTTTIK